MLKRALTTTAVAAALVSGTAGVAQAGPADRYAKELEQEVAQSREDARTPAYQKVPNCCVVEQPWGWADAILGGAMVAGAVLFIWN